VEAIYAEGDLPDSEFKQWFDINESLSRKWPVITKMKPAHPDAEEWAKRKDKLIFLEK